MGPITRYVPLATIANSAGSSGASISSIGYGARLAPALAAGMAMGVTALTAGVAFYSAIQIVELAQRGFGASRTPAVRARIVTMASACFACNALAAVALTACCIALEASAPLLGVSLALLGLLALSLLIAKRLEREVSRLGHPAPPRNAWLPLPPPQRANFDLSPARPAGELAEGSYGHRFYVRFDSPTLRPKETLHALAQHAERTQGFFRVVVLNQDGEHEAVLDAGGPRRQIWANLFKALFVGSAELGDKPALPSALPAEVLEDGRIPVQLSNDHANDYLKVGSLIGIALGQRLPIGPIFSQKVFAALQIALKWEGDQEQRWVWNGGCVRVVSRMFCVLRGHDSLLRVLEGRLLFSSNDLKPLALILSEPGAGEREREEKMALVEALLTRGRLDELGELIRNRLGPSRLGEAREWLQSIESLQALGYLVGTKEDEAEDNAEVLAGLRAGGLPRICETVCEKLIADPASRFDERVLPIINIAEGMRNVCSANRRQEFAGLPVAELQTQIQGRLSAEDVLEALPRPPRLGAERTTHGFLTNWIQRASTHELEQFVQAVTGARSLPVGGRFEVEYKNLEEDFLPIAHTCAALLELPKNYPDQQHFDEKIAAFLANSIAGSGFQFA